MQLTPAGRSAIAVVLVDGPHAADAIDACFQSANGKRIADQPADAIRFGRWIRPDGDGVGGFDAGDAGDGGGRGEELVVCRRGDSDAFEIHCHGGTAAVRAVLDRLVEHGCRETDWRAWLARSATSAIAAEAQAALAEASTERTAGVLLDQLAGALEGEARRAVAAIDDGDNQVASEIVAALRKHAPLGQHLTTPWRVVLFGPPNVGKSSLMNAMMGYERSIVFDRPGTTRDVVNATTAIDGWPVQLLDTAGLRAAADPLEAAGVELARATLAGADLVLAIVEASDRPAAERAVIVQAESAWRSIEESLPQGARVVRVLSKADRLVGGAAIETPCVVTSTKTGQGIDALLAACADALVPDVPAAGDALPFTVRQADLIEQAATALSSQPPNAGAARTALLALLSPGASGPDSAGFGSS
ncbi:MAG: GTPase [Planctomycetota bacterium]